jgi:hypothetical protein
MLDDETSDSERRSFQLWLSKSVTAREEGSMGKPEVRAVNRVEIVDVRIPFWSMVWLLLKVTLAYIPAAIIILLLGLAALGVFAALGLDG